MSYAPETFTEGNQYQSLKLFVAFFLPRHT